MKKYLIYILLLIIMPVCSLPQSIDSCYLISTHSVDIETETFCQNSRHFEYRDRQFDSIMCTYMIVGIRENPRELLDRIVYGDHSTYKYLIDVCDMSKEFYYTIVTFIDDSTQVCHEDIKEGNFYEMVLYKTSDSHHRFNYLDGYVELEIENRHLYICPSPRYRIVTSPNVHGRCYCP